MTKIILIEDRESDFNAIKNGLHTKSEWEIIPNNYYELSPYLSDMDGLNSLRNDYVPALLKQEPFAAIVDLEICGEKKFGYEIIDKIRETNPYIPIIVFTAMGNMFNESINHKVLFHLEKSTPSSLEQQSKGVISEWLRMLWIILEDGKNYGISNRFDKIEELILSSEERQTQYLQRIEKNSLLIRTDINNVVDLIIHSENIMKNILGAVVATTQTLSKKEKLLQHIEKELDSSEDIKRIAKECNINIKNHIMEESKRVISEGKIIFIVDLMKGFITNILKNVASEEQIAVCSLSVIKFIVKAMLLTVGLRWIHF